jgi:serine/threonine protein kinase
LDELRADDPRQVGGYALLARLGSGGMGQVYLGKSLGGRHVAVKVIRTDLARDRSFRLRFAREVAAARRVSGAFTAPVIDADPDAPEPWLVTEYVHGPSLAEAVDKHGPLAISSLLTLAARLAEGLSAVHAAGVIHRDLKPANVLLAEDAPRLIDFGISQAADFVQITSTTSVLGTPGFIAPELITTNSVGPASDVFSMGAVLAFAATGGLPFGGGPAEARTLRVLYVAPDLGNVPVELRELLERCMVKDPASRPTARQFLADLVAAHPEAAERADWLPEDILAEIRQRPLPEEMATSSLRVTVPPAPSPAMPPAPAGRSQWRQRIWATRTRTRNSKAPRPVPAVPVAGPLRNPNRRRIWATGVVAAVAVIGAVIGLLVAPSGASPARSGQLASAVRPGPTGLSIGKETQTSVALRWNAYTSGTRPSKYEILENGNKLVTVPGSQTKYQVTGLISDTAYQFSVIAITGTSRSAPSAAVLATTDIPSAPPLVDAPFVIGQDVTSQETASSDSRWQQVGATWDDTWNIGSNCVDVCATASLYGTIDGVSFNATLARSGGTYTGVAAIDNYWLDCQRQGTYEDSTLSIKLTVTQQEFVMSFWTVSAFTGTMTWTIPAPPDGCPGSLYQMQVSGTASQ